MKLSTFLALAPLSVLGVFGCAPKQSTSTDLQTNVIAISARTNAELNYEFFRNRGLLGVGDPRLQEQQREAQLILRADDWEMLRFSKPESLGEQKFPFSELGRHLLLNYDGFVSNAVVVVPQSFAYVPDQKSGDELMVDVAETLKASGIKNVNFHTMAHGVRWVELFPEGIPTREEVINQKEQILKAHSKQN